MQVAHTLGVACDVEQQRCGDVVRQVADQAHARGEAREIELERVSAVHRQLEGRETRRQRRRQVAVELDGLELAGALDERRGERAFAGANFHQHVAG